MLGTAVAALTFATLTRVSELCHCVLGRKQMEFHLLHIDLDVLRVRLLLRGNGRTHSLQSAMLPESPHCFVIARSTEVRGEH